MLIMNSELHIFFEWNKLHKATKGSLCHIVILSVQSAGFQGTPRICSSTVLLQRQLQMGISCHLCVVYVYCCICLC